jgi:hypothetical protein
MHTQKLLLAILALAAAASAQTRTVPAIADFNEGNDLTSYPFGRTAFRAQQLFESAYLAQTSAILTGIEYRADNDNSASKPAVTINNVQFDLSETTVGTAAMSTSYAANITGRGHDGLHRLGQPAGLRLDERWHRALGTPAPVQRALRAHDRERQSPRRCDGHRRQCLERLHARLLAPRVASRARSDSRARR